MYFHEVCSWAYCALFDFVVFMSSLFGELSFNIINVVNSPIIFGSLHRYRENHMISPVPMSYSGDYG